jgi:hypothetical protein
MALIFVLLLATQVFGDWSSTWDACKVNIENNISCFCYVRFEDIQELHCYYGETVVDCSSGLNHRVVMLYPVAYGDGPCVWKGHLSTGSASLFVPRTNTLTEDNGLDITVSFGGSGEMNLLSVYVMTSGYTCSIFNGYTHYFGNFDDLPVLDNWFTGPVTSDCTFSPQRTVIGGWGGTVTIAWRSQDVEPVLPPMLRKDEGDIVNTLKDLGEVESLNELYYFSQAYLQ